MISRGLRPCLVGGSFALCGNHPPAAQPGHRLRTSEQGKVWAAVGESELGDTYEGNLASKVASAGFLELVTASQLVVDKQATPSGSGCLKVSATT